MSAKPNDDPVEAVRKSGFPLQMRLADMVGGIVQGTVEEEIPWLDGHGDSQFMDFAAFTPQLILTFECKKIDSSSVTFLLRNDDSAQSTTDSYCLSLKFFAAPNEWRVRTAVWDHFPATRQARFAVNSPKNDGRIIEKDIQHLIKGSLWCAGKRWSKQREGSNSCPVIPIYITTAKLYTNVFSTVDVGLHDGVLCHEHQHREAVPYVRFTKTFVAHRDAHIGNLTAFIVNTESLAELLHSLLKKPPVDHQASWGSIIAI
jgi:hypothetical protein